MIDKTKVVTMDGRNIHTLFGLLSFAGVFYHMQPLLGQY